MHYICIYIYIYIYVYILEFDLPLYRDRVRRNPQVKLQRSTVETISKFRHSVVKVNKVDLDSKVVKAKKSAKVVEVSNVVKVVR